MRIGAALAGVLARGASTRSCGISPASAFSAARCRRGWRRRRRSSRSCGPRTPRRSRAPARARRPPRRRRGRPRRCRAARGGLAGHRPSHSGKAGVGKDRAITATMTLEGASGAVEPRLAGAGAGGAAWPSWPACPACSPCRRWTATRPLRPGHRPDAGDPRLRRDPLPGRAALQEAGGHPLAAGGQRVACSPAPRPAQIWAYRIPCLLGRHAGGRGLRLGRRGLLRRRPAACWPAPCWATTLLLSTEAMIAKTDAVLCGDHDAGAGGAGPALRRGAGRTAGRPARLAAVLAGHRRRDPGEGPVAPMVAALAMAALWPSPTARPPGWPAELVLGPDHRWPRSSAPGPAR